MAWTGQSHLVHSKGTDSSEPLNNRNIGSRIGLEKDMPIGHINYTIMNRIVN